MEVLVTGGAGFIGSHCVDVLLARGYNVTVLDDFSSGREANLEKARKLAQEKKLKLTIVRASIADPKTWDKLPRHDSVFHFAAQTSVTASVSNPRLDFETNVHSSFFLIEWVRKHKVRHLCYANTAGALYGRAASFPSNERVAVLPLSPYGATKRFVESYLSALCSSLKENGSWSSDVKADNYFSWASLRLGNVYGPRQVTKGEAGVVPIFIETLSNGQQPTIFGDGSKTRDYVHVSDVVTAFIAVHDRLQETPFDDFFNIASGAETRDIEVFDTVMRAMHEVGADPEAPQTFQNSLKVSQPLYAPVRAGEVLRSWLDVTKAEAFFAWRPRIGFHQGVKATVRNYFGELPEE
jgi:UDP-glucose 4-epimerase